MNLALNKYATAILQFVLILVASVQAALTDGVSTVEVWQLAAIGVANVGTYFVPLLKTNWVGLGKTGVAVAGAIIAAIIPIALDAWTTESFLLVVLAGLNALAAQAGVGIRVDSTAAQIADPTVANVVPETVDAAATEVVVSHNVARHSGT